MNVANHVILVDKVVVVIIRAKEICVLHIKV